MQCLIDAGPLVAALSRGNAADQIWARKQIRSFERPLITCDAVLTEASHFLGGPTSILRLIVEGLITLNLIHRMRQKDCWNFLKNIVISQWIMRMPA